MPRTPLVSRQRPAILLALLVSGPLGNRAGTSQASAHASGVAALIIGKNGGSMNPALVRARLRASADDLGQRGKDEFYGLSRVNAFRAVQ